MRGAGYSDKTLIEKLGYKPDQNVILFNPLNWVVDLLAKNDVRVGDPQPINWVHGFFTEISQIEKCMLFVITRQPSEGFWVSWPKKSGDIKTNVTEQTFRNMILPFNWVDVKVVAIDENWSGLLFKKRRS